MKKTIAALAVALLALGGVALSAAPASAHTGGVTGIAECEADGTYTVTWTYSATNVPAGVEAETKAMTTTPGTLAPIDGVNKGGQVFLSVWSDHQINVPGAPVKTGNWSAQFKTIGVPGDFKGNVTTMVQTDWKNGPSEDPVGTVEVDGSCETPPTPTTPEPSTTVTFSQWTDGTWACGDTTVTQTRVKTTTTTTYKPRLPDAPLVVDTVTPVQSSETQIRALTLAEQESDDVKCAGPQPDTKVVTGSWVTGKYECGDKTVTESRTVTTTTSVREGEKWVEQKPVTKTETRTRDLTSAEISALQCAVTPPVTPPTTTVVTPTPTPTLAPPAIDASRTTLAATGAEQSFFVPLAGGLAVALGCVMFLGALVLRRRRTES